MYYIYYKANPNRIDVYLTEIPHKYALALHSRYRRMHSFSASQKRLIFFIYIFRLLPTSFHMLMTSSVPIAAVWTIRVLIEEPVLRSVNPQVFGTTVPVLYRLLEDTARFSRKEAVRITKQPGPPPLDCTQLTMTIIKPSRCSVILTQSLGSLGTWLSRLAYPTKIVFRYLISL